MRERKRIVLLLAAAPLVAAGAWFATSRGAGGPRVAPPSADAARDSRDDAAPASAAALDRGESARAFDAQRSAPASERAPDLPAGAAELPLARPVSEGVAIRVVDAALQPAPGAVLVVLPPPKELASLPRLLESCEELAAAGAQRHAAGDDGRCRLPFAIDPRLVIAFAPGARGLLLLEPTVYFEVDLVVRPPFAIDIEVVDEAGTPRPGLAVGWSSPRRSVFDAEVVATTDAAGRCRFDELDLALLPARRPLASHQATSGEPAHSPWRVGVLAVAGAASRTDLVLPPETPPAGPIRLVVRDAGALEVVVRAPGDAPAPAGGRVRLRGSDPDDARFDVALPLPEEGTLRFEPLELGHRGTVELHASGYDTPRVAFTGPTRAGEVVRVELAPALGGFWVQGVALAAGGEPLSGRSITALLAGQRGEAGIEPDGRFRIDLTALADDDPIDGDLLLQVEAAESLGAPGDAVVGVQRVPRGVAELGTLRFEPQPLLVAGRVVDRAGAPLADASLSARGDAWAPGAGRREGETPFVWVRSDEAGRFAAYGRFAGSTCWVMASRRGLIRGGQQDVPLGTRDLELALAAGGSFEASFRTDGVLLPTWFRATIVDPATPNERGIDVDVRADGQLHWPLLPEGTKDLVVSFTSDRERKELFRIPGLEIRPWQLNRDPRALGIDPAQWVATMQLHASLPGGAPAEGARLVLDTSQRRPRGQLELEGGRATVPWFGDEVAFAVHAPGWRIAAGTQRRGRVDVMLEAPIEVELALKEMAPRADSYYVAEVEARSSAGTLRHFNWSGRGTLRDGVATIAVPDFGRYDLTLRLARRDPGGTIERPPRGTRDPRAGSIEVRPDRKLRFEIAAR